MCSIISQSKVTNLKKINPLIVIFLNNVSDHLLQFQKLSTIFHCHKIIFNLLSKQIKLCVILIQFFFLIFNFHSLHTNSTLAHIPLVTFTHGPVLYDLALFYPSWTPKSQQFFRLTTMIYPPSLKYLLLPLKFHDTFSHQLNERTC